MPINQFLLIIPDVIHLRQVLLERVRIGFSAATSDWIEIHNIFSWSFSSRLEDNGKKNMVGLGVGVIVGCCSVTFAAGILWFTLPRRRRRKKENTDFGEAMDDEFEKGIGPKRFTYQELSRATSNFSRGGQLGGGGF